MRTIDGDVIGLSFEDLKDDAPAAPATTCPLIDDVIAGIEDAKIERKTALRLVNLLEDIRDANEGLRSSGRYWYGVVKRLAEAGVIARAPQLTRIQAEWLEDVDRLLAEAAALPALGDRAWDLRVRLGRGDRP